MQAVAWPLGDPTTRAEHLVVNPRPLGGILPAQRLGPTRADVIADNPRLALCRWVRARSRLGCVVLC